MKTTGDSYLDRLLWLDREMPESGPIQGSDARLRSGSSLDARDVHFLAQRAADEVYALVRQRLRRGTGEQ